MEEKTGIETAINTLGEKIIELERSVVYERYLKEEKEHRISELEKENNALREKLNAVHKYIDQKERE